MPAVSQIPARHAVIGHMQPQIPDQDGGNMLQQIPHPDSHAVSRQMLPQSSDPDSHALSGHMLPQILHPDSDAVNSPCMPAVSQIPACCVVNEHMLSQLPDIGIDGQAELSTDFHTNEPLFSRLSSNTAGRRRFTAPAKPKQQEFLSDQFRRDASREASQSQSLRNADKPVDAWIDELDIDFESTLNPTMSSENMTLRLLAYQGLPRLNIRPFNGSPEDWIDFVINFRDLIHLQAHLSNTEKMSYLLQHLEGEARRAVIGFGYVRALKRLKYLFGQPSRVAQAHLSKVTKGKQIGNDDQEALSEYYYTINDCLVTLRRMCYFSDLYSTDVLRQAVRRLPSRLQERWCEHSLKIRRQEEPNLQHLEEWLQDRVLASMDPYMSSIQSDRQQRNPRPP